jgi:hypothetical protein
VTDRSDPLSTALACVRRLSDEGLRDLARAVHDEESARYHALRAEARWYTAGAGINGYRRHALGTLATDHVRRQIIARERLGPFSALCGQRCTSAEPEGEVDCPNCLAIQKRRAARRPKA